MTQFAWPAIRPARSSPRLSGRDSIRNPVGRFIRVGAVVLSMAQTSRSVLVEVSFLPDVEAPAVVAGGRTGLRRC